MRLNIANGHIAGGDLHRTVGLGVEAWPDGQNCVPVEEFDGGQLE